MSQATATKTTKSSGCGCGGGGGCGGSCGGGSACTCHDPCDTCAADTFVRPLFFAGQLLTEEDLQLLAGYTVAKDRLHNRHLHGAGVVCGLEVTCDPCGKGRIAVHPGYALDCCGNDILVPCTVELDVNAMIRRLRLDKLGGHDCGDPCEEEAWRAATASGVPVPERNPERAPRRYCLYVEYCEESTDPVAPYVAEEPCGGRPCKASRVREGYRFSLRCQTRETKPDNLFDRIKACLDDLPRAERAVGDAQAYDQMAMRLAAAQPVVRGERAIAFGAEDRQAMIDATARLRGSDARGFADRAELDEVAARRRLDALFDAARTSVAFALLDEAARSSLLREFPGIEDEAGQASEAARAASSEVDGLLPKLSLARDRTAAADLAEQTLRFTEPQAQAFAAPPAERVYFAHGALWSPRFQTQAALDLAAVREWLLDRLDRGSASDCHLRREVLAIPVPPRTPDSTTFSDSARRLLRAVMRYLLDCVCAALNPPCAPCDDPAVLLACLEVEECDVVTICNLERTWVLTPNALRYWLPLSAIGEVLEELCCELPRRIRMEPVQREEPLPGVAPPVPQPAASFFSTSAPLFEVARRNEPAEQLLRLSSLPEATLRPAVNVAGSLGSIAAFSSLAPAFRLPAVSAPGLGAVTEGFARGRLPREELLSALGETRVREALAEAALPAVEERVAARVAEAARPLDERAEKNAAAVVRLEKALEQRLTAKDLQEAKAVKDLRAANTTLKESISKLEKANADLAARLKRLESREVPNG